jgi:hypothetical protein
MSTITAILELAADGALRLAPEASRHLSGYPQRDVRIPGSSLGELLTA